MDITNFLGIAIVGIFVSVIINALKNIFKTGSLANKAITLVFCVAFATGYWFLSKASYWETVVGILAAASTFYAFVLKNDSEQ